MKLTRRTFSKWMAGSALGALLLQPAFAQNDKVRFGYLYANPMAALVAYDRGYFRDEGIDLELVPVQSGPAAVAATTNGAVDISFGDILGWASGLSNGFTNVHFILPGTHDAHAELLVRSDSPLRTPQDFQGKRIGVSPAPMVAVSVKSWLQQASVDPTSVNFVIIPTNGDGHALARGDVDAVVTFEPASSRLVLEQNAVAVLDPTKVAPPKGATFTGYFANSDFLAKNPDVAERFVRALRKGAASWSKISQLEGTTIKGKYSGIDLVKLSENVPGLLERIDLGQPQLSGIDTAATQGWIDLAIQQGGVPKPVDIAPYIAPSALLPTQP